MTPKDIDRATADANPMLKHTPDLYTLRHVLGDAETVESCETFLVAKDVADRLVGLLVEGDDASQEIRTTTEKWIRTAEFSVGDDAAVVSEWRHSAV